MKIFYYAHTDLTGQTGSIGSVRHVIEVVNRLSERGHEVTVFVPEGEGSMPDIEADKLVTFPDLDGYVGFLFQVLICTWRMIVLALRRTPDCFYAREMLYTSHTALLAKALGIPHVVEINGFQPEEVQTDDEYNTLLFPMLVVAEALNYWLSDLLITISKRTREKVINFYRVTPHKVETIRNGVNTERCRPMNTGECRELINVDPSAFWVGFLGYLFPWSGVDYLIKATALVTEEISNLKVMVIGSGTWGDHLPQLARENGVDEQCLFTGEIPWKDVPTYLNCLDVGVSPYTTERDTLDSLKTYEYMACGIPTITSDIPEVNQIVESHECGLVVQPEDQNALAQAIKTLYFDQSLRNEMANNARNAALSYYDWSRTVDKTEKQLAAVIDV